MLNCLFFFTVLKVVIKKLFILENYHQLQNFPAFDYFSAFHFLTNLRLFLRSSIAFSLFLRFSNNNLSTFVFDMILSHSNYHLFTLKNAADTFHGCLIKTSFQILCSSLSRRVKVWHFVMKLTKFSQK